MLSRLLRLMAGASLSAAALLSLPITVPFSLAHVGHGDEFQQTGEARQVQRNADSDALLGITTTKPVAGPDGLTVPATALVDANGKSLLFVQMDKTYDPVYVPTDANQGDRVVVTEVLHPTDVVVTSGALLLYAESMKTEHSEPTAAPDKPAEASGSTTTASGGLLLPALGVGTVLLLIGGQIFLSRRKKTDA